MALHDILSEKLEIHLMTDADARWNHCKAVERLSSPFQKLVPGSIAFEFHRHVLFKRILGAGKVDLNGVIDHEVCWSKWLNHGGVFAKFLYGGTHGRKIDKERYAGEVLQQNARHYERHFFGSLAFRLPIRNLYDVVVVDSGAVTISQDRLKYNPNAHRQLRNWRDTIFFELWE